jgi:hypothetical protein
MDTSNSFWLYNVPKPFDATERLVVNPDGSIHLRDKHDKSIARIPMATAHELLKGTTFLVGGIVASSAYGVGNAYGATSRYSEDIYGHGYGTAYSYGADGVSDGSGRSK